MYLTHQPDCFDPSGGYPGGGSNAGGGSSNDPPLEDEPVYTPPLHPCEMPGSNCIPDFDPVHENNCEELNKFSTDSYAQDEFNTLEGEINAGKEKGYLIKANPNFPFFTTDFVQSSGDCSQVKMPRNNALIYQIMHTHPTGCGEGTQPMFYCGDLHNLYLMSQNYNSTLVPELGSDPSLFSVYMTVAGYHYAIKINDPDKLTTIGAIFSDENRKLDFENDLENAFNSASNSTTPNQNKLTKAFLKFLKDKDLGVSLYRTAHDNLDFDPNTPPNERDAQWQQLVLNNSGTNYTPKDCN